MSICFRRTYLSDLDGLIRLAKNVEPGLTLPNSPELLEQLLIAADHSFKAKNKPVTNEYYFFVLENIIEKKIIGCSAIQATISEKTPFYSFKVSNQTRFSKLLRIKVQHEILKLVSDHKGKSELCTLFLDPNYRNQENGTCLSRSRFLFIKCFKELFRKRIIAELRGIINNNSSLFYDSVIFPFTQIPYHKALNLILMQNKEFIAELLPKTPIYTDLLTEEVRNSIGGVHPNTIPAEHMLKKQTFLYNSYVHVLDAGPTLEAKTMDITTIKNSKKYKLCKIDEPITTNRFLISNTSLDFKATVGSVDLSVNGCILSPKLAECLQVAIGNSILISPL